MRATNDSRITGHNRSIKFTDIPDDQIDEMVVVCNYIGASNVGKAVVFDKIVMPMIMRGLHLAALFDNAGISVDRAEEMIGLIAKDG